jgi:transposase InsO family protein
MDYLSLERSVGGYEYVLVITDHYTRFAKAIPTRNQTAITTARHLFDLMVNDYGVPEFLHSDQGPAFESKVIQHLCKMLGVKKTHTTPYHPQSNGKVERFNQSLISMLSTLPDDKKSRWKEYVGPVVHAYNCSVNDATGFSPFFLMFGREARLPVDILFGIESDTEHQNYVNYVQRMKETLQYAYKVASQHIAKSQAHGKFHYDRKAKAATVRVGDRILVRKVRFDGTHKLVDKWEKDIYVVLNQPDPEIPVFDVKPECGTGKTRRLHRNLLHPFVIRQEGGEADSSQWSDDDSDSEEILPVASTGSGRQNVPVSVKVEADKSELPQSVKIEVKPQASEVQTPQVGPGSDPQVSASDKPESKPQASVTEGAVGGGLGDVGSSSKLPGVVTGEEQIGESSVESVSPSELTEQDVENSVNESEIAGPSSPRRSGRDRKPPSWQTSGEYVLNFQQNAAGSVDLALTGNQQMLLLKMLLSQVMPK